MISVLKCMRATRCMLVVAIVAAVFTALWVPATAAPRSSQKRSARGAAGKAIREPAALLAVEKHYLSLKSLSQTVDGRVDIAGRGDQATATISGKVEIARPGKFRLDMTLNFFGEDRHVVIVSNGRTVTEYDPDDHVYTEQPLSNFGGKADKLGEWFTSRTFDASIPLFLAAGKDTGEANTSYQVGTGSIDGQPVTVVSMRSKGRAGSTLPLKLYLDMKDKLIRRFSLTTPLPASKTGGVSLTLSLTSNYVDIDTEINLPDDTFEFSAPDGARRVPAVRSIIQRAFDLSK